LEGKEEGNMGAVRGKVVFSPRAVQATALGGRWLEEKKGAYSSRVDKILAKLLKAHIERLESGGDLAPVEELVRKAERCGIDGNGLDVIMADIRDVFEPSRRPHRHLRGGN
jgi:hypothetical protein